MEGINKPDTIYAPAADSMNTILLIDYTGFHRYN